MKINAPMFGLAFGIMWAAVFLLLPAFGMAGWGVKTVEALDLIYFGFGAVGVSVLLGMISGFVWGFVICWLGALIYNHWLAKPKA